MFTKKSNTNRRRVLIYGLNFSPEQVGIGKYTGEMASWLSTDGFKVRVVTAPSYFPAWRASKNYYRSEHVDQITVIRCPLYVPRKPNGITRLIHLLSFAASSLPVILWQVRWKPDIVITIAPAFFCAPACLTLQRLCACFGNKVKTQLHIQDFELDAAFELGILKGKLIKSFAERWEQRILSQFMIVSTISEAMYRHALKKGVAKSQCKLLPNWVDTAKIFPLNQSSTTKNRYREELGISNDMKVILYSGSMNKKQDLETVAKAIKELQSQPKLLWAIAGEGPTKHEFVRNVMNHDNVIILPLQSPEKLNDWLNLADIHLLPQKKGAADLVLPSKLMGIMASGKPVIASSPVDSELGQIADQVGLRVDPGNCQQLVQAISRLITNPALAKKLGDHGRRIAVDRYDVNKVMQRLVAMLS